MKKLIAVLIVGLVGMITAYAEKNSPWKEIQAVEIPSSITIYEGTTRTGNPKCWIELEDMKIPVSVGNAEKFKAGKVKLELVKWYNESTQKYKYTTRQKKGSKSTESKNLNLMGIF